MAGKRYWLYIMASERNGTLYVGMTSDLIRRVGHHRQGLGAAFVEKHNVTRLVCFEAHAGYEPAREREIRLKKWRRAWKIALIEASNPQWRDLYRDLAT